MSDLKTNSLDPVRLRIDEALKFLRNESTKKAGTTGTREIKLAITKLEEAGMWVNRIEFIDAGEYSPILKK